MADASPLQLEKFTAAGRIFGLQIEYSLLERELIPLAKDQQMTVLAWSPLKGGARLGSEMMKDFAKFDDASEKIIREVVAVAKELGVSAAQVSLAWLRPRPVPVISIIGARKMSQLEDNIASLDVTLSPEHLQHLDDASKVSLGFPHDMISSEMVQAFRFGGLRDRIKA